MKKQFRQQFWTAKPLNVSQYSPAFDVRWHDNIGIQLETTGVTTNTGTFLVEGTNENPLNADGSQKILTSWEDIGVSPVNTLANADVNFMININQFPFSFVRVHFTPGGDTPNGTVVARIQAKGI